MIRQGDKIPDVTLRVLGPRGIEDLDFASYIGMRHVVLFGVPGAYTPVCSQRHLPSYVRNAEKIKAMGVDEIICTAVNDPFVMQRWAQDTMAEGVVTLLPDGNGELARALGLVLDARAYGLGMRSQRYSMVIQNGVVVELQLESAASEIEISDGDSCLALLVAADE